MDVVGINKEFFFFKNKNKENCHDDVIYNYILGHITYGILLIKLCLAVRIIFTLKAYIDVDLSPKEFFGSNCAERSELS